MVGGQAFISEETHALAGEVKNRGSGAEMGTRDGSVSVALGCAEP